MSKSYLSISKAAEFRLAVWFLEAGWEVFLPAVQARQTDFVVRFPSTEELLAIEVKSTQCETKNAGQATNEWKSGKPPFDYFIFIEGKRERGVILPKKFSAGRGRTLFIFSQDQEGYSRGEVRRVLKPFSFDLQETNDWQRAKAFCERFISLHQNSPPMPPIGATSKKLNGILV
jgi:hypothetical protein